MPGATAYGLFCLASLALAVVPGPAVTYIVAQSVDKGRRAGLVSALGIGCGGLVHVAAATAGLSALIASSASAFTVVKLVGAAYLVVIGLARLTGRGGGRGESEPAPAQRLFVQGLVVNILNPKTALFFLAFLPQFVDPDGGSIAAQVAMLGITFVAIAMISDGTYAVVAAALAGRLRRSRRAGQIKRFVSGGIFVALGLTAATAHRNT